ncbi:hypothetical protein D3C71_1751750 [compost metagenome]
MTVAEAKAGAVGSMVTDRLSEAALELPAASEALVVRVWLPDAMAMLVMDQLPAPSAVVLPSTVVPSVSYRVTSAFSPAVPEKVGVVALVMLSVLEAPVSLAASRSGGDEAAGATVSMV